MARAISRRLRTNWFILLATTSSALAVGELLEEERAANGRVRPLGEELSAVILFEVVSELAVVAEFSPGRGKRSAMRMINASPPPITHGQGERVERSGDGGSPFMVAPAFCSSCSKFPADCERSDF